MWSLSCSRNRGPALSLQGYWRVREFAHPVYMCVVDLEKVYDCVPPVGCTAGVWGTMTVAISHPVQIPKVRALSVLLAGSQTFFQWVLSSARVVPCNQFCL